MCFLKICTALLAATFALPSAFAQDMPAMPGMEHHHNHDDAAALNNEQLGSVHFPVSCMPATQKGIERGVALLHSFGYVEAERQFREVAKADPRCAMSHWGLAMTQFHELWGRPEADAIKTGQDEIALAEKFARSEKITPREKGYIDALNAFYTQVSASYQNAAESYASGMKNLHEANPQDVEAAAFYALAELASEAPDDTSLQKERTALAVLLPLFKANPDHPGLAHYIIHTCDTPKLAAQGLDAAKVYAKIAPSSAHALHMPGHIFARLGLWQEDIDSNLASVAASKRAEAAGQPGVAHQMHADEFLIYAYLQTGQEDKAHDLTAKMREIGNHVDSMPGMDDMKGAGPYFDNELNAIYLLEMHDWAGAEKLQPAPNSPEMAIAVVTWANVVGAGHLHEIAAGEAGMAKLNAFIESVRKGPRAYRLPGLMIYHDEMAGWTAYAEGKPTEAIGDLRKAADQQDKLGQGEVDIPAREMLADLLLALHKAKEALTEYQVALQLSPNRLNGLLGAGEAAEQSGDRTAAMRYYAEAARNTQNGISSHRAELAHAVDYTRTCEGGCTRTCAQLGQHKRDGAYAGGRTRPQVLGMLGRLPSKPGSRTVLADTTCLEEQ